MIKRYILLLTAFVLVLHVIAEVAVNDEQTCRDICSSCKGLAKFENGRCECEVFGNEGSECIARASRDSPNNNLEFISCQQENDERQTRCLLGLTHKNRLGARDHVDRVAKYFLNGGPRTSSVFQGTKKDCNHNMVGSPPTIITQPIATQPDCVPSKIPVKPPPEIIKPDVDCTADKIIPSQPIVGAISPLITQGRFENPPSQDDCLPEKQSSPPTNVWDLCQNIASSSADLVNHLVQTLNTASKPVLQTARNNLGNLEHFLNQPNTIVSAPAPKIAARTFLVKPAVTPGLGVPGLGLSGLTGGYIYTLPAITLPQYVYEPPEYVPSYYTRYPNSPNLGQLLGLPQPVSNIYQDNNNEISSLLQSGRNCRDTKKIEMLSDDEKGDNLSKVLLEMIHSSSRKEKRESDKESEFIKDVADAAEDPAQDEKNLEKSEYEKTIEKRDKSIEKFKTDKEFLQKGKSEKDLLKKTNRSH